jgi:diaminopimelate decarboxylase
VSAEGSVGPPERYLELTRRYGSPLYIYDAAALTGALDELTGALPAGMEVFYSLKANPNISVVAVLAAHGARAEVSSLVELQTALKVGVEPRDIIFLGPGKKPEELEAAVEAGIYAVVAESFDELDELDRLAAARSVRQAVLIRINPQTAGTGSRLTMGGKARQFGIDEVQVLAAGDLPKRYPALDLIGVHAYLGTRILDGSAVVENTKRIFDLAERVAEATGIRLDAVDVGGGLGVAYFEGEQDPDLKMLRAGMEPAVESFRRRHPGVRLLFESGRYLAARAGVYAVTVRCVKESMGRDFAVTDGGTHHHLAAVGTGSIGRRNFPIRLLSRHAGDQPGPWQLTGPLCTPNDTIGKDAPLPRLRAGDVLGIMRSGAYGPTASPGLFLSHGFPAEVLIRDGESYLVRDRDEPEDLLRKQHLHTFVR